MSQYPPYNNQPPYYPQGGAPPPQQYPPQQSYPPYDPNAQQQWGAPPPPQGHEANRAYAPSYAQGPPQGYQQPPPQGYSQQPPYQPPQQQQNYPPQNFSQPPGYGPQPYGGALPQSYQQQPAPYGQPPFAQQNQHFQQQIYSGFPGNPQNGAPPPLVGSHPAVAYNNSDPGLDADALRKAMKGLGTDERALINILANRDGHQIDAIRIAFSQRHKGRSLIADLDSETSSNFKTVLHATALGAVESEAYWVHSSIKGAGTRESLLTESIFGRTPYELRTMKDYYHKTYHTAMEKDVRGDLSFKTEKLFEMAMQEAGKMDPNMMPNQQIVTRDVQAIYAATSGQMGTDEMTVCNIFAHASIAHLRSISADFSILYRKELRKVVASEFSYHMKDALLYILDGANNIVERDARLLEESMKGLGTKDNLLISRLVRIHWDKRHLSNVKTEYKRLYGKELVNRIKGETSGDYRDMLVALAMSAP